MDRHNTMTHRKGMLAEDALRESGNGTGKVEDLLTEIRDLLVKQGAAALGRDDAAAYLGVSTATLERLTSAGKIKSVRVSEGRVVWRRVDLNDYLDSLAE